MTDAPSTVRINHDENGNAWADLTAGGSLTTRRIYADAVDALMARIGSSNDEDWYLTDLLGSVRDIADSTGAGIDHLDSNTFDGVATETSLSDGDRYAWTGRERDAETGLQYNRARWYDPASKRWLSQDPIGFDAGDSNLYRYASNSSASSIDPSGLDDANPGFWRSAWLYTKAAGAGVGEGFCNIRIGTAKAAREAVYMGSDVLRMTGSAADNWVINPIFGGNVYVSEYRSSLARGAVAAGSKGELASYTGNAIVDGASLGLAPIYKAVAAGDAAACGDAAGAAIFGVFAEASRQNPYSLIRTPGKKTANNSPAGTSPFDVQSPPGGAYSIDVGANPGGNYSFNVGASGSGSLPSPIGISPFHQALPFTNILRAIPTSLLESIVADANRVASPGGAITEAQASLLRQNLPVVQRRGPSANAQLRREFVSRQFDLMAEWEVNSGRTWPTDATPHHIIPLESGGANAWWNLMPTNGSLPNHSLPGIAGPYAAGSVLRQTVQRGRRALPPGTTTDLRSPR